MKQLAAFFILLIAAAAVFGQAEEITAKQFRKANSDARKMSRSFDRRIIQKSETYEDGKLTETSLLIWEYALPDRRRAVSKISSGGKEQRTELIEIGKAKYCKRGDEAWTTRFGECIGGSGSGGPDPIIDRYTLSEDAVDGQKLSRFKRLMTYRGSSKDDGRTYFWETTFWVDEKGRLIGEQERRGVSVPYSLTKHLLETYEYEPEGLRIEAPILQ